MSISLRDLAGRYRPSAWAEHPAGNVFQWSDAIVYRCGANVETAAGIMQTRPFLELRRARDSVITIAPKQLNILTNGGLTVAMLARISATQGDQNVAVFDFGGTGQGTALRRYGLTDDLAWFLGRSDGTLVNDGSSSANYRIVDVLDDQWGVLVVRIGVTSTGAAATVTTDYYRATSANFDTAFPVGSGVAQAAVPTQAQAVASGVSTATFHDRVSATNLVGQRLADAGGGIDMDLGGFMVWDRALTGVEVTAAARFLTTGTAAAGAMPPGAPVALGPDTMPRTPQFAASDLLCSHAYGLVNGQHPVSNVALSQMAGLTVSTPTTFASNVSSEWMQARSLVFSSITATGVGSALLATDDQPQLFQRYRMANVQNSLWCTFAHRGQVFRMRFPDPAAGTTVDVQRPDVGDTDTPADWRALNHAGLPAHGLPPNQRIRVTELINPPLLWTHDTRFNAMASYDFRNPWCLRPGSRTIYDLSGFNRHVTANATSYVTSPVGTGTRLNRTVLAQSALMSPDLSAGLSVELLFRINATDDDQNNIQGKDNTVLFAYTNSLTSSPFAAQFGFYIQYRETTANTSEQKSLYVWWTNALFTGGQSIQKETWYHVVLSFGPTDKRWYVNDSLKSSTTIDYKLDNSSRRIFTHFHNTGVNGSWGPRDATVAIARMYSRPLTAGEVTSLYASAKAGGNPYGLP